MSTLMMGLVALFGAVSWWHGFLIGSLRELRQERKSYADLVSVLREALTRFPANECADMGREG